MHLCIIFSHLIRYHINILLRKLRDYKINKSVIFWIESFLCYRKQRVKINGCFSDWVSVLSGIPQETILGPLLFIIYMSDLPEICKQSVNVVLFADDAKLYKYVINDDDHLQLL